MALTDILVADAAVMYGQVHVVRCPCRARASAICVCVEVPTGEGSRDWIQEVRVNLTRVSDMDPDDSCLLGPLSPVQDSLGTGFGQQTLNTTATAVGKAKTMA